MLMLMNRFLSSHESCNIVSSYDDCAMSIVFNCLQKSADFSNSDFRGDGNEFQHVGPETANARGPYVTVRVCGRSRSPLVAACS